MTTLFIYNLPLLATVKKESDRRKNLTLKALCLKLTVLQTKQHPLLQGCLEGPGLSALSLLTNEPCLLTHQTKSYIKSEKNNIKLN